MDKPNTDVIQGAFDMLILKALSFDHISRGVFRANPGSLLTAFQQLERVGWLDSGSRQTDKARRVRFYRLTRSGKRQLEVETADWSRRASPVAWLLKGEG